MHPTWHIANPIVWIAIRSTCTTLRRAIRQLRFESDRLGKLMEMAGRQLRSFFFHFVANPVEARDAGRDPSSGARSRRPGVAARKALT